MNDHVRQWALKGFWWLFSSRFTARPSWARSIQITERSGVFCSGGRSAGNDSTLVGVVPAAVLAVQDLKLSASSTTRMVVRGPGLVPCRANPAQRPESFPRRAGWWRYWPVCMGPALWSFAQAIAALLARVILTLVLPGLTLWRKYKTCRKLHDTLHQGWRTTVLDLKLGKANCP